MRRTIAVLMTQDNLGKSARQNRRFRQGFTRRFQFVEYLNSGTLSSYLGR